MLGGGEREQATQWSTKQLVRLVPPVGPGNLASSARFHVRLHPCRLAVRWALRPTWPRCTSTPSVRLPLRERRCLGQTQQQTGAVIRRRARDCLRTYAALRQMAHVNGPWGQCEIMPFEPLLRVAARTLIGTGFPAHCAANRCSSLCLDVGKHQAPHKLTCLTFPQGAPAESRI